MLRFCMFFMASFVVLSSCNNEKLRQETIKDKIAERVSDFSARSLIACEQRALDLAVKMSDSILIANADLWQIRTDLMDRPPVPLKPSSSDVKVKVDSSKVEPIFPISENKIK